MNTHKKWAATVLAGALSSGGLRAESGFSLPPLSLDMSCKFETERVERGARLNQQTFTPKVEVSTPLFGEGEAYFGSKSFLSIKNSRFNKYDLYLGASYSFPEYGTLDAGFIHHIYRNRFAWIPSIRPYWEKVKRHSEEFYIGCTGDFLLNPSLYYCFDLTQRRHNLEGEANYLYDLSPHGLEGFATNFSAKVGYDRIQRPFGLKDTFKAGGAFSGEKKGYLYYGAGADIVYTLNGNTTTRAGLRYEGANGKKAWISKISEKYRRNLLWFSTSIDCSF